jgi:hypothetical protein
VATAASASCRPPGTSSSSCSGRTSISSRLAIADNRIAELDLDWDPEALLNGDVRLDLYFGPDELKKIEREAESAWVSQGVQTEKESKAAVAKPDEPTATTSAAEALAAVAPAGAKPKTVHECPHCGHQW